MEEEEPSIEETKRGRGRPKKVQPDDSSNKDLCNMSGPLMKKNSKG